MRIGRTLRASLLTGAIAVVMSPAMAAEPLKFGVLTGLTGGYGPWGEAGLGAAQIAAAEINAAGGVNGRPVELVVSDNRSTVEGAISGWRRLVDVENVVGLLGVESDAALALLDDAAAAKVPIMCPVCGTPELATKGGDYVWRLTSGDNFLGVAMAQSVLDKTKEVSIITQSGLDATEGITRVFKAAFEKGGGKVVSDIHISATAASFRGELDNATAASPYLFLSTGLEVGTRLLTEYTRRGYEGTIFAIPELSADEVAGLGSGAFDGKMFAVNDTFDETNPTFQSFAKALEAKAGVRPTGSLSQPNYYDQLIIFALAATAAGADVNGETIRNHLVEVAGPPGILVHSYAEGAKALQEGQDIDYHGASGPVDFDAHGSVATNFVEITPKGGTWENVRPLTIDESIRPE